MLDSDIEPDPAICLRAAGAAIQLSDYALAERLARAATNTGGHVAQFLHGFALSLLLRGEDAEKVLSQIPVESLSDSLRAEVVSARVGNLLFVLERATEADAVLNAEEQASGAGPLGAAVVGGRAVIHATQARPQAAVDTATSALASSHLSEWAEMFTICGLLIGLSDLGRVDNARPYIARGQELAAQMWEASSLRFLFTDIHEAALRLAGHVDEAETVATGVREAAIDAPGLPQVFATAHLGEAALGAGRLPAARQLFRQALAAFTGRSWEYRYRHDLAQTLAMLGEHAEAADTLGACEARTQPRAWLEPQFAIAQAWVWAAGGAVTGAAWTARRTADLARARGQIAQELLCLQTATQFGDRSTADRLHELAALVQGPRAAAAAAYAEALASDDGPGLRAASVLLEQMGDRVAAADAAAHASTVYGRAGRRGSATACAERARRLADECGGPVTPALRDAAAPATLTRRQREIITLAAQGLTNKQIADRLHVSIRTVEGHIYRAGTKTGATGRTELAQTLRGE